MRARREGRGIRIEVLGLRVWVWGSRIVGILLACLVGAAVNFAVHDNVDLERLGIVSALILVIIPIKFGLDFYIRRKFKQEIISLNPQSSSVLLHELEKAPLELTARQGQIYKIISTIKDTEIKKELKADLIKRIKLLLFISILVSGLYLAYLDIIGVGVIIAFFLIVAGMVWEGFYAKK